VRPNITSGQSQLRDTPKNGSHVDQSFFDIKHSYRPFTDLKSPGSALERYGTARALGFASVRYSHCNIAVDAAGRSKGRDE
jgi:hypothetical protein